ncbi:MAG: metallophosphoesterase [Hyphomicrobiaceae bacterium]|nr:metallophosphoesterase [Hyphomicrobiaceae bacterium]
MGIAFVHTADWQLGKPFARFDPDVAARLAAARLDAIDRVAGVAVAAGIGLVLVAGDVFDSERASDGLIRTALGRMDAYRMLVWHLLPGNHDPARPGGVWARLPGLGMPPNVMVHLAPAPAMLSVGCVLLPAPLAAKEMQTDPTLWMDSTPSPEGTLRIGLAHGSVQGFGSLGEAAVPIDAGRRRSAGLDYLALGDWHGTKEIASGVWYSGTPEPDSFADNGPGHALLVRLDGPGAPPVVEVVGTSAYRWLERRVVMSRLADLTPLEDEAQRLGPAAARHIVALALEGAISVGDSAALETRLAVLSARLMALDLDRRRLRMAMSPGDLALLGEAGPVEAVARRLAEKAAGAATAEARVAERALGMLFSYATPDLAEGAKP